MPSIKNILHQYGGFLVALVAIALTVVAPRSEELFGISTTKCLLIGTRFITSITVCLCVRNSFRFSLTKGRLKLYEHSPA
jgi:hypothetical protein